MRASVRSNFGSRTGLVLAHRVARDCREQPGHSRSITQHDGEGAARVHGRREDRRVPAQRLDYRPLYALATSAGSEPLETFGKDITFGSLTCFEPRNWSRCLESNVSVTSRL